MDRVIRACKKAKELAHQRYGHVMRREQKDEARGRTLNMHGSIKGGGGRRANREI